MNGKKLIVAMTGATGAIFGVRLLELLHNLDVETHFLISKWGAQTLSHETAHTPDEVKRLATYTYPINDQSAPISSGSFVTDGMVIIPCSMRTLSAVAHSHGDNLIHRAADVVLKEGRKLTVVARESPLHAIHLENMLKLARLGAVILPPVPAFYNAPRNIDDLVNHIAGRVLDQFEIHLDVVKRWDGTLSSRHTSSATTNAPIQPRLEAAKKQT